MVKENKLWGAERIRGELLKLGMELSKRTIQKYTACFSAVALGSGIKEVKTPYRTPQANGICERFIGSLRRECIDHVLIHGDKHLRRIVTEYTAYFNEERPHQGIDQRIPGYYEAPKSRPASGHVTSKSILGGLHHSYSRIIHLN